MTDLVPRDQTDTWVDLMGPVGQLAQQIARTPFVPKALQGQPAAVAASILTGREMGLGPMTSLRGVQIIEGRPSLTSELLAARIFAAGHRIEWKAVTDERVTVRIERADGLSEAEITWTIRDAQRAGLAGKGAWAKYPRAMLRARALSECAQLACPDVGLGLDVAPDPEQTQPRPPTTVVQVAPPTPPEAPYAAPAVEVEPEPTPDPEPAVEPADEPGVDMITKAQLRKIGAMLGEVERASHQKLDREQRRLLIATLAGINPPESLASANDLTMTQASAAIDALGDYLPTDRSSE